MGSRGGSYYRTWLGLPPEDATFARRGFRPGDPPARLRLEEIGRTFIEGYNAALDGGGVDTIAARLESVPAEPRGFAYEGAAMALALLDGLTPWSRGRFPALLNGPGYRHVYMFHVGAGWALARLPWGRAATLGGLSPLLRWLAWDGYGFHQGYFHWPRYVASAAPNRLGGYAARAFDQGLGRSLWFVEGADVARVGARVASFPAGRRRDLWSGVGLACAYAGGVDRGAVEALWESSPCRAELAQGAACAAKARHRAGNPAAHTESACRVFCGVGAAEAAGATDVALAGLPDGGEVGLGVPRYEAWRAAVRAGFSGEHART